jgi:hypothetical protein
VQSSGSPRHIRCCGTKEEEEEEKEGRIILK